MFFPSYSALQSAHTAWSRAAEDGGPGVAERLKKIKSLIVEPKESSELQSTIESYRAAVQSSVYRGTGGAVLLAVCRGKLSEESILRMRHAVGL